MRAIQKLANHVAGQERKYLLRDESIFHESDEEIPADDYKGDEPNETLKPWDQKNVSRPFIARGHYFDVNENGDRMGKKDTEAATQTTLIGNTERRVAEDQEVGGTTGLQPDWKALTNFKMTLQHNIEEINQKIDASLAPDPSMLIIKSLKGLYEQSLKLTVDDFKFFYNYFDNDQPHTPAARKRFERLTLPVSWFWFWYGYHSDSLAKKEAQKKRIVWDAERQNRRLND